MKSLENILVQTAAPKESEWESYGNYRKVTQISMHLKDKDWRRFWGKKAARKVPEWPCYGNFSKVTQNPHFLKKCKGGTKGNFSKIAQKDPLAGKAQKQSGTNGIIV